MNSGIYKLYWKKCDYFYYGQSQNLKKRKSCHFGKLKTKIHSNKKLQNVFEKYGIPLFEVVEYLEAKELDKREQYFIDIHIGNPMCCNLVANASTNRGHKWTEEMKNKLRGRKLSPEHCKKISNALSARIVSDETKRKISNSHIGFKHSEASRQLISEVQKGKIRSKESVAKALETRKKNYGLAQKQETKDKIRKTLTGHSVSPETRKKISEGNKKHFADKKINELPLL